MARSVNISKAEESSEVERMSQANSNVRSSMAQNLKGLKMRKKSNMSHQSYHEGMDDGGPELRLPQIGDGARNMQSLNSQSQTSGSVQRKMPYREPANLRSLSQNKPSLRSAEDSQGPAKTAAKKSKWQIQSEQFRAAMRASSKKEGDTKVEEVVDDGRKQCPYCSRKFNPEPYERHLPICPKNKGNKGKMKI
uniref:C2HC/C3H-type domain-containing protein n=1 Tax=Strombidium rassoulzadegani TaxID=1082188 RepID=A0A7S3CNL9_9SPIT|mmetsp:Transcript_18178/g.31092  ORF Transcript_18178/g.31092 Transcript_18178/m.31092 type:complete len:193 (+) Transcript_18178:1185-1763(+)